MLEFDYSGRFESLIDSLDWQIQLPEAWATFFSDGSSCVTVPVDERQNTRTNVRIVCAMCIEQPLPAVPRTNGWLGIYSKNFSRRGCGFVSSLQLYPEEIVRIVLPTLWVRVRVVRACRIGPSCFETGAELLQQHQPHQDAFAANRPNPIR